MDITKAIIAGIATILSALLTLLLKEYWEKRRYKKIGSHLKDAVYGKWKGKVIQTISSNMEYLDVQLDLKVAESGAITGTAKVPKNSITDTFELNLVGGFYSDRFFKVDYENSNKAVLQFGTFIFKISDDAVKLNGHFVGHGYVSGNIIAGSASFEKV